MLKRILLCWFLASRVHGMDSLPLAGGTTTKYPNLADLHVYFFAPGYVQVTSEAYPHTPDKVVLQYLQPAGDCTIHTECQGNSLFFSVRAESHVHTKIYTAGRILDALRVTTSRKAVLTSLMGHVAKRIVCVAHDGNIAVSGLPHGEVDLSAANGAITVEDADQFEGAIIAETSAGAIHVKGARYGCRYSRPWSDSTSRICVSTTAGKISFTH